MMSKHTSEQSHSTIEHGGRILATSLTLAVAGAALAGCATTKVEATSTPEPTKTSIETGSQLTSDEFVISSKQTPQAIAKNFVENINKLYSIDITKSLEDKFIGGGGNISTLTPVATQDAEIAANGMLPSDWKQGPLKSYVDTTLAGYVESSLALKAQTDPALDPKNNKRFSEKQLFNTVTWTESADKKTLNETIVTNYTSNYKDNTAASYDNALEANEGTPITTDVTFDISGSAAQPTSVTIH